MSTLSTTEALVIDGANGVTRASRESFPASGWAVFGAVAAALVLVAVRRWRARWTRFALGVVLLVSASPGLVEVLGRRADAPASRWHAAEPIAASLEAVRAAVPWPAPIDVRHEADGVSFPFSRYAAPTRASGGRAVEVRGEALPLTCREDRLAVTRCEGSQ